MTLKTKIEITLKEAIRSKGKFRLAAIVWQGSKIKGIGWNQQCNNFGYIHSQTKRKGGIHAEALAIIKANTNRVDWRKATITVARINKTGLVRNAKPCKHCFRLIRRLSIKNVYWSEESKKN